MNKRHFLLTAIAATALSTGVLIAPSTSASTTVTVTTASQTLASGSWTKKSFKASGTWSIYSDNGKTFVRLSDDFKTRKAPDLKIFLSPLSASQANGRNATDGSVLIAPLTSNSGGQVYEIPAGVDIADYKSILIHCEAFSKLWSTADL